MSDDLSRYDARTMATQPALCPVFVEPPAAPWIDEDYDDGADCG